MRRNPVYAESWLLFDFPDGSPEMIAQRFRLRELEFNRREWERANWIWQRRPREFNALLYGAILALGGLLHLPFLVLGNIDIFVYYHSAYILLVGFFAALFVWNEARRRRWQKDYLRAIARLGLRG